MRRRSPQVGDAPRCRYISGIGQSKATMRACTHPGQPTAQLGTCLDEGLAQLGQGSDAGGEQVGGHQAALVADSAEGESCPLTVVGLASGFPMGRDTRHSI
jgi:predicted alpha/beta-hydrolase family hydrolase